MDVRIRTERIDDLLFARRRPVLEIKIEYPVVSGNIPPRFETMFNAGFLRRAREFNDRARSVFYAAAKQRLNFCERFGFSFDFFICSEALTVTLATPHRISLYMDRCVFTGESRQNITRSAMTFSVKDSRRILPPEIFRGTNVRRTVTEEICRQIRQSDPSVSYLEDAEQRAVSHFNAEHFYLTTDGVCVFYPAGTIAPFDAGIRPFFVDNSLLM